MCNDIVVIEYHRRRSGLSNAPLDMEYDNRTEQSTAIATSLNINYIND
tara:strand:+ start:100 stop:243 length:144 start_codon:yes stop_codon:yes gene_type:complete